MKAQITELENNDIVWNNGYRMRAIGVTLLPERNLYGREVYSYTGTVLDDVDIKNTYYDGARYTWTAASSAYCTERPA